MEHRIDQLPAMHKHEGARGIHRFTGSGRFGFHPPIHLARHRSLEVPATTPTQLSEGVGASGHSLGLQGRHRPGLGHFTANNTGEIGLDR